VNFAKLLKIDSFFPTYIILEVGKQHDLEKKTKLLEMLLAILDHRRSCLHAIKRVRFTGKQQIAHLLGTNQA
jgi:hypothetical protein